MNNSHEAPAPSLAAFANGSRREAPASLAIPRMEVTLAMSRSLSTFFPKLVRSVAPLAMLGFASAGAQAEMFNPNLNYGSPIQPAAYRTYADEEAVEESVSDSMAAPECLSCDDAGCDACCSYPCYCWYVSVSGAWQDRETVHEVGDPPTFLEFNDGFGINIALGHEFELFRLEFEYSYLNNQVAVAGGNEGSTNFVSDASGNISVKAFMLNVYHDFDFGGRLKPYVGGGIGLFQSEINSMLPGFFADPNFYGGVNAYQGLNTTSDVAFAYQFRAGVNYELTRRTELFAGYRFFDNGDPLTFAAQPFGVFYPDSATFHSAEAGLRIKF
jgi:opacity protein-like surface antigen